MSFISSIGKIFTPARKVPPKIMPSAKDFRQAATGTILPKGETVILSSNQALELGLIEGGFQVRVLHLAAKLKEGGSAIVGRACKDSNPDIGISWVFTAVSRKHLKITKQGGNLLVTDTSKHGTKIIPLEKTLPQDLTLLRK